MTTTEPLPPEGPPRGIRVDGQDFENAEAVNRYLVSDYTKAELIDLLMVFIKESAEREAASPALDVERVRRTLEATKSCTADCDHDTVEWTWTSVQAHAEKFVAEYARLTAAVPEEPSE